MLIDNTNFSPEPQHTMSTSSSLRALARGDHAVRRHLRARRDQSPVKGWTFSKLEYLSRSQLIPAEEDKDMSEARWAGRETDKRQQEARRRELRAEEARLRELQAEVAKRRELQAEEARLRELQAEEARRRELQAEEAKRRELQAAQAG